MPSTIAVVARGSLGWIHTGFGGIGTWEEGFGGTAGKVQAEWRRVRGLGHGAGTTLAEVAVNHGTAEKVEAWFRAHGDFGANTRSLARSTVAPTSVADELAKLAQLRDAGVLSPAEFEAQKAKLLN
jgi:hypothetical protein